MAEFDLFSFTSKLKEWFLDSHYFPYMYNEYKSAWGIMQDSGKKHPNRHPAHLKDVARQCFESSTIIADNIITFDYGNAVMESNYPYYHILENTPAIRKQNKGTLKSRGSEYTYKKIGQETQADYERVIWNGKTFTKEYRKNVRGCRNRIGAVSYWATDYNGDRYFIKKGANSYLNVHYQYIEHILNNDVTDRLALEFGLKRRRNADSGLEDDFAVQEGVDIESVLETFASFE